MSLSLIVFVFHSVVMFVIIVLSGSPSTYSYKASSRVKEYPQAAGNDVLLVSAVQTRNNARVVFSGSIDLFSNRYVWGLFV